MPPRDGDEPAIAVLQVNADVFPDVVERRRRDLGGCRYRIGYWTWELEVFPEIWSDRFALLDEVWTPSSFAARGIAMLAPVPVCPIPHSVVVRPGPHYAWSRYGIAPGTFVVLFLFDCWSRFERKNPLGLLEAFTKAFRPHERVALVLKALHPEADPASMDVLRQRAKEDPRVVLLEGALTEGEVHAMLRSCDVYCSLHRSEGFGLTMAEAMAYGKPVVATGYSANLEFMDVSTSYLVGYGMTELQRDEGPYPRGAHWADPDLDHAAALLRTVYENPLEARRTGQRAARTVARLLAPEVVGNLMRERIDAVQASLEGMPA
jgi:glycosyltransferase involved in cell wall biosynthesis